jgi:hypothetical protein
MVLPSAGISFALDPDRLAQEMAVGATDVGSQCS